MARPRRPGTPLTRPTTTGATTASSAPADPSRCSSPTSAICCSHSLAGYFPFGQRYFSSVLAQTYPNRRFFFAGTASGTIATNNDTFKIPAPNGTIFDRLDAHHIDYRIYYQQVASWLIVPGLIKPGRPA